MRSAPMLACAAACLLLLAMAHAPATAQDASEPVVVRSEDSSLFQVWVVDPESGLAAFFGGDIVAICRNEPDAHDLLDITEVYEPQELASVFAARGTDIGASLWDHAPPFNPRLCQDILAREGPIATGTASMASTGRFPRTWADPSVKTVYGITAQGTMQTTEGETLRVNAHWRCQGQSTDTRCSQGVVVNQ